MNDNKLFDVQEIRDCERFTMEKEHISSLELMEWAGAACADAIASNTWFEGYENVYVYVGAGNNGGDGVVIAAHLFEATFVHSNICVVVCASETARYSEEMQHQLKRWNDIAKHHDNARLIYYSVENQPEPKKDDLIVDALFGIGLNKPVTGFYADVIHHINASDAYTISIIFYFYQIGRASCRERV